jgi:hypothetical protein
MKSPKRAPFNETAQGLRAAIEAVLEKHRLKSPIPREDLDTLRDAWATYNDLVNAAAMRRVRRR